MTARASPSGRVCSDERERNSSDINGVATQRMHMVAGSGCAHCLEVHIRDGLGPW